MPFLSRLPLVLGVLSALLIATGLAVALKAPWVFAGYLAVGLGVWLAFLTFALSLVSVSGAQRRG